MKEGIEHVEVNNLEAIYYELALRIVIISSAPVKSNASILATVMSDTPKRLRFSCESYITGPISKPLRSNDLNKQLAAYSLKIADVSFISVFPTYN